MTNTNAQTQWKVNKSLVTFKIKNFGFNVDGFFKGFEGDITFEEDNLEASSISASVEAKTINTNNSMRDSHLRRDDYFGVEQYPKISMQSVSFKKQDANTYLGTFKLTIKGKTKTITFPFTFDRDGNRAALKGKFEINRRDFGVGGASAVLSNNARLDIKIEMNK